MTMLVVGLTGGIGSGKSTVAGLFAEKNITIIDADQIARDVIEPGQPALTEVIKQFGAMMVDENGHLNRAKLRALVFADQEKRLWLEALLHPLIRDETQQQIAKSASPYCIVMIPLLFETEPNPLIQRVLVVDATEELQRERTMKRDRVSREAVQAIINAQITREKRLELADDIIENHGSRDDLIAQVDQLHAKYLALA